MRIFPILALASLLASPVAAADLRLPLKAPPAAAQQWWWSGFYVGGNLGYGRGRADTDWSAQAPEFLAGNLVCSPAGRSLCLSNSDSYRANGGFAGLQAGYNWKPNAWWMVGVEADIQWINQSGGVSSSFPYSVVQPSPFNGLASGVATLTHNEKLTSFGTVRARAGLTADRLLFFATGGLAVGRLASTGNATVQGFNGIFGPVFTNCAPGFPPAALPQTCQFANWSNTTTRVGWTAGAGLEGAITAAWSVKLEFLYIDFGSFDNNFSTQPGIYAGLYPIQTPAATGAVVRADPSTGVSSTRITEKVARIGLNYRFGTSAMP